MIDDVTKVEGSTLKAMAHGLLITRTMVELGKRGPSARRRRDSRLGAALVVQLREGRRREAGPLLSLAVACEGEKEPRESVLCPFTRRGNRGNDPGDSREKGPGSRPAVATVARGRRKPSPVDPRERGTGPMDPQSRLSRERGGNEVAHDRGNARRRARSRWNAR